MDYQQINNFTGFLNLRLECANCGDSTCWLTKKIIYEQELNKLQKSQASEEWGILAACLDWFAEHGRFRVCAKIRAQATISYLKTLDYSLWPVLLVKCYFSAKDFWTLQLRRWKDENRATDSGENLDFGTTSHLA